MNLSGAALPVTTSFTDDGACQYTLVDADFTTKTMVAPSGVMVMYSQSKTNANLRTISFGLPEQNLPVSELSGTWNAAGWDPASGIQTPGFVAQTNTVTFDGSGAITANASCVGLNACTPGTAPFASFAANSSGGFDLRRGGADAVAGHGHHGHHVRRPDQSGHGVLQPVRDTADTGQLIFCGA